MNQVYLHIYNNVNTSTIWLTLGELFLVALFEMVSAEVMVFDAIAEHEVDGRFLLLKPQPRSGSRADTRNRFLNWSEELRTRAAC